MSANEAGAAIFKPKKSVALSGVTAGNTALCTVGRSGNDLHYRGYDILEVAETCEFEEIGLSTDPRQAPERARARRLQGEAEDLRGIPAPVRAILEQLHRRLIPWTSCARARRRSDVFCPRPMITTLRGRARFADLPRRELRLDASATRYHWSHNGQRIHVETDDDSVGGHFLHLLHRRSPPASWVRAMHTSLNCTPSTSSTPRLHARVIAARVRTSTPRSPVPSAHCAAPSTAAPTKSRWSSSSATPNPDEAEADIRRRVANKEIVIGFGHPVYTVSDPRNVIIKRVAEQAGEGSRRHETVCRSPRASRR
jgi:2-methylcitrate synthase